MPTYACLPVTCVLTCTHPHGSYVLTCTHSHFTCAVLCLRRHAAHLGHLYLNLHATHYVVSLISRTVKEHPNHPTRMRTAVLMAVTRTVYLVWHFRFTLIATTRTVYLTWRSYIIDLPSGVCENLQNPRSLLEPSHAESWKAHAES